MVVPMPIRATAMNNQRSVSRYLRAFETGSEAKKEIGKWLTYYNTERPHSTHGILTPDEAYDRKTEPTKLAA